MGSATYRSPHDAQSTSDERLPQVHRRRAARRAQPVRGANAHPHAAEFVQWKCAFFHLPKGAVGPQDGLQARGLGAQPEGGLEVERELYEARALLRAKTEWTIPIAEERERRPRLRMHDELEGVGEPKSLPPPRVERAVGRTQRGVDRPDVLQDRAWIEVFGERSCAHSAAVVVHGGLHRNADIVRREQDGGEVAQVRAVGDRREAHAVVREERAHAVNHARRPHRVGGGVVVERLDHADPIGSQARGSERRLRHGSRAG